jgi:hypothetical protein
LIALRIASISVFSSSRRVLRGLPFLDDLDRAPDDLQLLGAQLLEARGHLVERDLHLFALDAGRRQLPRELLLLLGELLVVGPELLDLLLPSAAAEGERGGEDPGEGDTRRGGPVGHGLPPL